MSAFSSRLTGTDRQRLLDRLADEDERALDRLAGLDRLMREPGGLPPVPEPVPLHRAGRDQITTGETAR